MIYKCSNHKNSNVGHIIVTSPRRHALSTASPSHSSFATPPRHYDSTPPFPLEQDIPDAKQLSKGWLRYCADCSCLLINSQRCLRYKYYISICL